MIARRFDCCVTGCDRVVLTDAAPAPAFGMVIAMCGPHAEEYLINQTIAEVANRTNNRIAGFEDLQTGATRRLL